MCESHALRVSVVNITFMSMTFQHLAVCVDFYRPQVVCYEGGKKCLSTFQRVFPIKIDGYSMFARQTTLHLLFRVFHLCARNLRFMIFGISASFGTVFPRYVKPHSVFVVPSTVFHESDDVSVFVAKCLTDQKSGLLVIVDFVANKNSFQKSNKHCSVLCLWCVLHVACFLLFHRPHHPLQGSSESIRHVSLPTVQIG